MFECCNKMSVFAIPAEKEAEMMEQKADFDVHLHVLQCQKAVAPAEAEIQRGSPKGNIYIFNNIQFLFPNSQHNAVHLPGKKKNDSEVDLQDSTQMFECKLPALKQNHHQ